YNSTGGEKSVHKIYKYWKKALCILQEGRGVAAGAARINEQKNTGVPACPIQPPLITAEIP
ncbi:MAG: hypothetical protein LUH04_09475, partial [Clostridium sp.]|nr:hypothetical protein [Clostridium sp.]